MFAIMPELEAIMLEILLLIMPEIPLIWAIILILNWIIIVELILKIVECFNEIIMKLWIWFASNIPALLKDWII